jgi:U32 family peptidase
MNRKPELMSPAGYWPELNAAIEAGADAVYFGLHHFTARAKVGFDITELLDVMKTLHSRAVKGFVTFNTLVFDHELLEAERAIAKIAEAGADAIIVQDVAIAKLARKIAPDLEVHGSTQMSITSAQGAELAKSLGCSRVVLGRELSLLDIERIAKATDVELEVFVHGALCVSYSGQCFSSEAWGGRSANRGKCAQACRLPYDLMVDNEQHDLGEYRYLLSPGDLFALHQIPELVRIGVACFKIEGRYKDAQYVAAVTQSYRKAIDEACADLPLDVDESEEIRLEQVYSRGLGDYFISGTNHQKVVRGRAPRHRGVQVGEVVEVLRNAVHVRALHEIKRGDGLVFDAASWRSPDEKEEGGNIYEVKLLQDKLVQNKLEQGKLLQDNLVTLEFGNGEIDFSRIRMGDLVWRTHDPHLQKIYKPITEAKEPLYTRPLTFNVVSKRGERLVVTAKSEEGLSVMALSDIRLEPASKRALDEALLREHLGKLGGTAFHLESVTLDFTEPLFIPISELNSVRRECVEQLMILRIQQSIRKTHSVIADELKNFAHPQQNKGLDFDRLSQPPATADGGDTSSFVLPNNNESNVSTRGFSPLQTRATISRLHVLVRTQEQLEAAIATNPESITLDYLELYGLKPSVEKVKAANILCRVASPRILKPNEQNVLKFLLSLECDILVRSGGLLYDLQQLPNPSKLIGDFSLNAANVLSSQIFLDMGLSAITPTHDLNAQQIADLAKLVEASKLEVIAYQHLPVFHTEHCVFCRFLSTGTDYTNCGHPCEKHRVALRDKQGRLHPVMADVGCRNTVFGAEAQTGAKHLQMWLRAGLRDFRLEFVHESPAQVQQIIKAFQKTLSNGKSFDWLQKELANVSPSGITEGSLFTPEDFSHLSQLL